MGHVDLGEVAWLKNRKALSSENSSPGGTLGRQEGQGQTFQDGQLHLNFVPVRIDPKVLERSYYHSSPFFFYPSQFEITSELPLQVLQVSPGGIPNGWGSSAGRWREGGGVKSELAKLWGT